VPNDQKGEPAIMTIADVPPALHAELRYYYPPAAVVRRTVKKDLCVYGGSASGVICAVQAARLGRSVVVVNPAKHVGGMTTGGLSWTDFGNKAAIGGMAREFYRRCGARYGVAEEWCFEPKVAERVLEEMLAEAGVVVYPKEYLRSVRRRNGRVESLTTESGLTVEARMFVDATYEGDLMARARVSYTVGREGNRRYAETLNGVQYLDKHQFDLPVSPYVREGDPSSGLLPGIEPRARERTGTGDRRIQAYNFRLILTRKADNRLPFPKPEGYDPAEYVLTARYLAAGWNGAFGKFDPIRGDKVDKNNHGATSTDYIGANYRWPTASYAERERIFQAHVRYVAGWFWFMANDPSVPADVRARMAEWGLCRDEFTDTGGWPHQLYVREARRMVSDYVITEHDCRGNLRAPDPVGLGSYGMDSHNCRRYAVDGRVMNEGDVQVGGFPPYPISYRSIVPKRGQCTNLLVPVCISASHIAYGSARMEPVFMVLGQSAAIAADLALERDCAVQDVEYAKLRSRLIEAGQVLEW
jgi:hypothetical protein